MDQNFRNDFSLWKSCVIIISVDPDHRAAVAEMKQVRSLTKNLTLISELKDKRAFLESLPVFAEVLIAIYLSILANYLSTPSALIVLCSTVEVLILLVFYRMVRGVLRWNRKLAIII